MPGICFGQSAESLALRWFFGHPDTSPGRASFSRSVAHSLSFCPAVCLPVCLAFASLFLFHGVACSCSLSLCLSLARSRSLSLSLSVSLSLSLSVSLSLSLSLSLTLFCAPSVSAFFCHQKVSEKKRVVAPQPFLLLSLFLTCLHSSFAWRLLR